MTYYPNDSILVGADGDILMYTFTYKKIFSKAGPKTQLVKTEMLDYVRLLGIPPARKAKILGRNILVITRDRDLLILNEHSPEGLFFYLGKPIANLVVFGEYIGLIDTSGGFHIITIFHFMDVILSYDRHPSNPVITDIKYIFENDQIKNLKNIDYLMMVTHNNVLILESFSNLMKPGFGHLDMIPLGVQVTKIAGPIILIEDGNLYKVKVKDDRIICKSLDSYPTIKDCLDISYDFFTNVLLDNHSVMRIYKDGDTEISTSQKKLTRLVTINSFAFVETQEGELISIPGGIKKSDTPVVLFNDSINKISKSVPLQKTRTFKGKSYESEFPALG